MIPLHAVDTNLACVGPAPRLRGTGQLLHLPLISAPDPPNDKVRGKGDNTGTYHKELCFPWWCPQAAYCAVTAKGWLAQREAACWSHRKCNGWPGRFYPAETEDISRCFCDMPVIKVMVTEDHSRNTAPSSQAADPHKTQAKRSSWNKLELPTHGNATIMSSAPGMKTSAEQEAPNRASRAKDNKNQSQYPEHSSLQYLGSAEHKSTSLVSVSYFSLCPCRSNLWHLCACRLH